MKVIEKLSTYAALIGVIGAIGGGFYTWGQFNLRLDQIENKEFVVNETVDLTKVFAEIGKIREQIAMLPEPANLQPILDKLKMLEEYGW